MFASLSIKRSSSSSYSSVTKFHHRFASTLVVAEHKNGKLSSGTLSAITCAQQLQQSPIHLLILDNNESNVVKQASAVAGIDQVIHATSTDSIKTAESITGGLKKIIQSGGYSHVVAAHSAFGKNLLPRVAALLDVQPVSDVMAIKSPDTFVRPIYAGNALCTVKSSDKLKVLTVRTSSFPAAEAQGGSAKTTTVSLEPSADASKSQWVKEEMSKSDRPELGSAKIVLSGGRGMKNAESFQILYPLADKLKAAVGASRAAVDAGYAPNDLQIGQTGKIIAPQLYIAFGISGAIQHLAGMKDSKVIVAVNKDPEAPIFQVADYGLVADLFDVIPELEKKL